MRVPSLGVFLAACGGAPPVPPPPAAPPAFVARAAPADSDGVTLLADFVREGAPANLRFQRLVTVGQTIGSGVFGRIQSRDGAPFAAAPLCDGTDFGALWPTPHGLFHVAHLECAPGAIYLTRLDYDAAAQRFSAVSTAPVDDRASGNIGHPCAAVLTAWGTVLGSEEYEPDAALLAADGRTIPADVPGKADGKPYFDHSQFAAYASWWGEGAAVSPYTKGWTPELSLSPPDGAPTLEKHYAMGRFSHELAVVLPDDKTVVLSDDGSYGGLFLFVADTPRDLRAGTLYASRWAAAEGGAFTLDWVSLGHATDAEIAAALATPPRFADLFDATVPDAAGACPDGFTHHRAYQAVDRCLRLRPGQERLASRLETRRAAALRGATVEIQKGEGLAWDPRRRRVWLATTRIDAGMLAGDPPAADHIALPANPCGAVWGLDLADAAVTDTDGAPIASAFVPRRAAIGLAGVPVDGACPRSTLSEPDNVVYAPELDLLFIGEDTDRAPNQLWAARDGEMWPVLEAPAGAEITGLWWSADVGGAGWLSVSVQHPDGAPAFMGVLGPFPVPGARGPAPAAPAGPLPVP